MNCGGQHHIHGCHFMGIWNNAVSSSRRRKPTLGPISANIDACSWKKLPNSGASELGYHEGMKRICRSVNPSPLIAQPQAVITFGDAHTPHKCRKKARCSNLQVIGRSSHYYVRIFSESSSTPRTAANL